MQESDIVTLKLKKQQVVTILCSLITAKCAVGETRPIELENILEIYDQIRKQLDEHEAKRFKITHCTGEGQGSCKRCEAKGKWNRTWMCFLYKIEGFDGCYCEDCLKELFGVETLDELEVEK